MVLDDFVKHQTRPFYYGVTASDVSRAALTTGRAGVYHRNRVKNVPADFARHYLGEVDADHVRVSDHLKRRVCFTHTNLLALDSAPVGAMDIILCQNVLIYFKQPRRQQILQQLVEHLKPGGLLVLGAGEIFSWQHPAVRLIDERDDVLAFRKQQNNDVGRERD
jgi:chemotaxis protein methyltransferase CheR/type IV pilus assembly protein PilK